MWPNAPTFTTKLGNDYVGTLRQEAEAAALCKPPLDHFGIGILFAVPSINVRYVESAAQYLRRKYQEGLGPCLEALAREEGFHVLWGKYLREDLLLPEAFHQSSTGSRLTCPGVDVIIAKMSTAPS